MRALYQWDPSESFLRNSPLGNKNTSRSGIKKLVNKQLKNRNKKWDPHGKFIKELTLDVIIRPLGVDFRHFEPRILTLIQHEKIRPLPSPPPATIKPKVVGGLKSINKSHKNRDNNITEIMPLSLDISEYIWPLVKRSKG